MGEIVLSISLTSLRLCGADMPPLYSKNLQRNVWFESQRILYWSIKYENLHKCLWKGS